MKIKYNHSPEDGTTLLEYEFNKTELKKIEKARGELRNSTVFSYEILSGTPAGKRILGWPGGYEKDQLITSLIFSIREALYPGIDVE